MRGRGCCCFEDWCPLFRAAHCRPHLHRVRVASWRWHIRCCRHATRGRLLAGVVPSRRTLAAQPCVRRVSLLQPAPSVAHLCRPRRGRVSGARRDVQEGRRSDAGRRPQERAPRHSATLGPRTASVDLPGRGKFRHLVPCCSTPARMAASSCSVHGATGWRGEVGLSERATGSSAAGLAGTRAPVAAAAAATRSAAVSAVATVSARAPAASAPNAFPQEEEQEEEGACQAVSDEGEDAGESEKGCRPARATPNCCAAIWLETSAAAAGVAAPLRAGGGTMQLA